MALAGIMQSTDNTLHGMVLLSLVRVWFLPHCRIRRQIVQLALKNPFWSSQKIATEWYSSMMTALQNRPPGAVVQVSFVRIYCCIPHFPCICRSPQNLLQHLWESWWSKLTYAVCQPTESHCCRGGTRLDAWNLQGNTWRTIGQRSSFLMRRCSKFVQWAK